MTIFDSRRQEQAITHNDLANYKSAGNLQTHLRDSEARIKQLEDEKDALQGTVTKLKEENQDLKTKLQDQTWKVKDAEEKLRKAEASVQEKEAARAAAQTELDDFLLVLGDLEEKRTRDKVSASSERQICPIANGVQKRLKELGEEISDAEDEDEGEEEGEGEEEDEE